MNQFTFTANRIIKNYLPLLFWLGLIFFLSHQPNLKSGLENWLDLILRKIAHIAEFAILTFLFWRALPISKQNQPRAFYEVRGKILISVCLSFLYALLDEYHQSFILGRDGNWRDVGMDSVGILIAGVFLRLKIKVLLKLKG